MTKNKGLGLIGLLIVVVIIFVGVRYATKNLESIKTTLGLNATSSAIDLAKQAVQKIERRSNLEIEPPSDTSDWKTYSNEKYGFEFKYPPNWDFGPGAPNSNFIITINDGKSRATAEGITVIQHSQPRPAGTVGNADDSGWIVGGNDGMIRVIKYFNKPIEVQLLNFTSATEEKIGDQILSTFKFTK